MGNFIPAFVSALKGGTIGAGAGATAKTAAFAAKAVKVATPIAKTAAKFGGPAIVSSAITKAAAPKPPATPTQISKPPTVETAQVQYEMPEDRRQMDLLSTIIAGRERKNKLG